MGYTSEMLSHRVVVAKRKNDEQEFGKSGQPKYRILGCFWAAADFSRGTKSLREGVFDAYDTVMFRFRFNPDFDRWCLIQYHDKWYQILSFNADIRANQIQVTATEMANQNVNIV